MSTGSAEVPRDSAYNNRYTEAVSKSIPVRLDDDEVAVLDELVRLGLATNRSDAIKRGIDRDRRRLAAMRDARIYAQDGEDPDLEAGSRTAFTTQLTELD